MDNIIHVAFEQDRGQGGRATEACQLTFVDSFVAAVVQSLTSCTRERNPVTFVCAATAHVAQCGLRFVWDAAQHQSICYYPV